LWKNKPISSKGVNLGNNFGFNNLITGVTAWYEPSYIDLFIYFKTYGIIFFILFISVIFFILSILINSQKKFNNVIIIFSLLKLISDLYQDGFVESCYSFLLLASTLLLFNYIAQKLILNKESNLKIKNI
jgi:hypothetical protein